jgi:transcriptional regulator
MSTYNPPRFQGKDRSEALDFISVNSFAAVITVFENNPTISQLPLTIEVRGDDIFLIGHLAKQNPHANIISKSKVTVLFHGAHTYITPVWYAENDVPTWNYSSVQVTGDVELIEDNQGLIDCLQVLTTDTEKKYPSGWNFFIPDDLQGPTLTKSIVGFKIKVSDISFKQKLSQNRSAIDRKGILDGLAERTDAQSQAVLADTKRLYNDDGSLKKQVSPSHKY